MANCPKCGVKLKITDISPNCPNCGINLVYYGMEERLLEDADKAESEHAVFQKKLDMLKAAFIGSPLTIVRIVMSLLPIAALMLPLANVSFWGPYFEVKKSINAITIYETVSSLDFDALIAFMSSKVMGPAIILYAVSIIAVLLSLVFILVGIIMIVFSCGAHGSRRNIAMNSVVLALSIVSTVAFQLFTVKLHAVFPTVFNGSVSFGAYIYIALNLALLVLNIVIAKVGIPVKYKETFVGGIPSDEYFSYLEQGMDTRSIRKMMAEIDAKNKLEAALKAKEEAEAAQAEGDKLLAEAQLAEKNGDRDAGAKAQKAAQAVDDARKKAIRAAELAAEATAAAENLKQFETPGENAAEEEKETVSAGK